MCGIYFLHSKVELSSQKVSTNYVGIYFTEDNQQNLDTFQQRFEALEGKIALMLLFDIIDNLLDQNYISIIALSHIKPITIIILLQLSLNGLQSNFTN